jgi:hypothetical protein
VKALAALAARITDAPLSPDRGGYTLTMRECRGSEETLAVLEQEAEALDPAPARLHLGWGSFRNLDIVAVRRSAAALLLDVNIHQHGVWQAVREALAQCADAQAFIEQLAPRLPHTPRLRQFADNVLTWLRGDLERAGSWLNRARPGRFEHVRALFAAGSVAMAALDLRGGSPASRRFDALARELQALRGEAGLALDTVYISNIPWMLAQPRGFFGEPHEPYLASPQLSAAENARVHLGRFLPQARWVISAMRLRADASPDNLQWLTECLQPKAFLESDAWEALGRHCSPG